jgi:hypothetical protein
VDLLSLRWAHNVGLDPSEAVGHQPDTCIVSAHVSDRQLAPLPVPGPAASWLDEQV